MTFLGHRRRPGPTTRTLLGALLAFALAGPELAAAPGKAGLAGLYRNHRGRHIHLWPDGHFSYGKPKWRVDGSFDFQASTAGAEAGSWGTYEVEPDPRDPKARLLKMTRKSGHAQTCRATPLVEGGWRLWAPCEVEMLRPAKVQELVGRFSRAWSGSTGDLTVGAASTIELKPGRRFALANVVRESTISGGGSESTTLEGAGKYRIDGLFLVLTFDDGTVIRDLFQSWDSSGDASKKRLSFGSHVYTAD